MSDTLRAAIRSLPCCMVHQRREMVELIGFEARNKYSIDTEDGRAIGFAAEQGKTFGGVFMRQVFGHWRSFEMHIFDSERRPVLLAKHPFRFYFARIEVSATDGRRIGTIEQQFSVLRKKFRICDASGATVLEMAAPIISIWQFPVFRQGQEVARIVKKWGGVMREGFLDADTFRVEFASPTLTEDERILLLVAALFIDLRYFETKAESPVSVLDSFIS